MLILTPAGPVSIEPAPGVYDALRVVSPQPAALEWVLPGATPVLIHSQGTLSCSVQISRRALARLIGAAVSSTAAPLLEAIPPAQTSYREVVELITHVLAQSTTTQPTDDPFDSLLPTEEAASAPGASGPAAPEAATQPQPQPPLIY